MKSIKFKQGIAPNQEYLFAKTPSDFLSDNHLAKAVYEIVDVLDLSKIESKYSDNGQHAFSPRIMIRIFFYGYSTGVRSSRKISNSCEDRYDFSYLTGGLKPSHDRISDFRKDNIEELKALFQQIVLFGSKLGLVTIGKIKSSIDGTKIKANASSKLSKDEDGLNRLLEKTKKEIDHIFEEAERIDREEDKKYGRENRGDELPKHLRSKKSRAKAIKEALNKLREEKDEMKMKILTNKGRKPTKSELKKIEKKKINITDTDANFMKQRNGVIKPCYNAQASVDEQNQFIVANDVTDQCNDQKQLIPLIIQTKENIGADPNQVKADNGYFGQLEDAKKLFPKIDLYVDDKNRRKEYINFSELKQKYSKEKYENLLKIVSPGGEEEYKKRMYTIEPVFGNLKENLGFRSFSLRELDRVKGEFNLMCIAHNIKKIQKFILKKSIDLARALSNIGNIKEKMKEIKRIRANEQLGSFY